MRCEDDDTRVSLQWPKVQAALESQMLSRQYLIQERGLMLWHLIPLQMWGTNEQLGA